MKKSIRTTVAIAMIAAIVVGGCAGSEKEEDRQFSITETEKKNNADSRKTDDVTETEGAEPQQTEENTYVVWTDFEKVDYAVLAAILHSTTNCTVGCELVDLDNDGAEELIYIKENEKWAPRLDVYVADMNNQTVLSYILDMSASGDATISLIHNQLWFCVAYAKMDGVLFENYMWDGEWKYINDEEFDAGTDAREVVNSYNEVETIEVSNGNYEEIIRLYREHLDSLQVPYNVLEDSSKSSVTFEVEDYAASWKRNFKDYEEDSVGLNPDIKDGISIIEISKDADENVKFSVCIDNQRTVLN